MYAVDVRGLTKTYGNFTSLSDCSFAVRPATVFGLLGPNGAGKTTLIRMLLGFVKPSSGSASISGFDVVNQSLEVRSNTSYLPGEARLYRGMSGRSILKLFSGLHPRGSLERSLKIADRLELDYSRRVMFMSTGMRQKLALAIVLGCEAPLTVLDEPTANLDPNVRATVLELIREVRSSGRTVMLSSHIFSDIDDTCDEVVILKNGKLVTQQSLAQVGQKHIAEGTVALAAADELQAHAKQQSFVEYCKILPAESEASESARIELHFSGPASDWLNWLAQQRLDDIHIERAGIRAVYSQFNSAESQLLEVEGQAT